MNGTPALLENDGCDEEAAQEQVAADAVPAHTEAAQAGLGEVAVWCLTGMSGWWSINVITAELPYFVAELPEKEALGNLIAVCTQLGNILPIAYKAGGGRHGQSRISAVIIGLQTMAVFTLAACCLVWNVRTAGHSVALLVCTVLAGGVGCMSNVTYWAVVADRPAACTRSMSVGMTLGGLLATGLSALQMAGRSTKHPRFSPAAYFAIAAAVQTVQVVAFAGQVQLIVRRLPQAGPAAEPLAASSAGEAVEAAETPPGREVVLRPRNGKCELPPLAKLYFGSCFLIYGATYAMPTLQPFIAAAYGSATQRQQLLLAMLVFQNAGDVLGRALTCLMRGSAVALISWACVLTATFILAALASCCQHEMAKLIVYGTALLLAPALCGAYYFSRGLLVTSLYLKAREIGDSKVVTKVSSDMGFWGQMGALGANVVTFLLVSVFHRLG